MDITQNDDGYIWHCPDCGQRVLSNISPPEGERCSPCTRKHAKLTRTYPLSIIQMRQWIDENMTEEIQRMYDYEGVWEYFEADKSSDDIYLVRESYDYLQRTVKRLKRETNG